MRTRPDYLFCIGILLFLFSCSSRNKIESEILSTPGLVAFWDFSTGKNRLVSKGEMKLQLQSSEGDSLQFIDNGPVSGRSILLDGTNYLYIPYEETEKLNIETNEVTVVAWVKWTGEQTGFVGGMWNEYEDGGKRQYGLFVSLPHYNGKNQVCGHISKTGKPTPPFPYSIDYSASKQEVTPNEWECVAFTYDGEFIRSYLNGEFEEREPELINNTRGFEGYPEGLVQSKNPYYYPDGMGNNGSDFTVGAVRLKNGMGNFFKGQMGGLAVFNRALTSDEIFKIFSVKFSLKNPEGL
ncbi:MAG: LamG domain-containing protein [Bacteroidales bacterium]|jgi:hypothetical protein|nr:LamG domain-containing protein [Bacteroidales bacterium]